MPRNWKKQALAGMLAIAFIAFTVSGVMLIDLTFTIAPFAVFGLPYKITLSLGQILIILAFIALTTLIMLGGASK